MSSASGSARWRRWRSRLPAVTPEPPETVEREPTFVCSVCHREMPEAERSRIAIGRCRACV